MEPNHGLMSRVLRSNSDVMLSLAIMTFFIVLSAIIIPNFLDPTNLSNILRIYAPGGIMAIGLAMILLTGEIDVSIGSIMSLSVMVGTLVIDVSQILAIVLMIAVGAICGLVNGLIVTKMKVPSLIVTIGMLSVYAGLASIVVNAQGTVFRDTYPVYSGIGRGDVLGLPLSFVICLVFVALCWWLTTRTRFGRDVYFTGANKRAAWMSGVNIDTVRVAAFVIGGVGAALCGFLISAQIGGASVEIGQGKELTAIAIAVLGGVSLFGGRGSVLAVLIGMVTMGVFLNMLALSRLGSYVSLAMQGVLVVAVVFLFALLGRWSMQKRKS